MKSSFCDICGMTIAKQIVYDKESKSPRGLMQRIWSEEKLRAIDPNEEREAIRELYPILKYFAPGADIDFCHECLTQSSKGFMNWVKARREEAVEIKIWSEDKDNSGDSKCWK